jgi:cobalt-zinc-cadmium resistance protein CzcA
MKFNFINILIAALLSISNIVIAQPKNISLDEATTIAMTNNAKLRTEAQWTAYQRALVNTSKTLAPTQITAELGQFNSAFFDTGFGISQSFQLPSVYKKRSEFNIQKAKTAEAYFKMTEMEIKQHLEEIFAEYQYLEAKTNLLIYQDSLYANFQQKAQLRWQKGETNILEKTTADQQKINISQQMVTVNKMKNVILLTLNYLLNDGKEYAPNVTDFDILKYNILFDSNALQRHPVLLAAMQEINTAKAATNVEKSALLPDFSLGYRNVGIRGTGADNVVYSAGDRFSSVQVSVGIPIFRKGIQSAIQGAQMLEAFKVQEYASKRNDLNNQIRQQYEMYSETQNQINIFEKLSLPNARSIRDVSEKKFENGEINYLEYVMLTNQAIQIESDHLELIRNMNGYIIKLYYLTNGF